MVKHPMHIAVSTRWCDKRSVGVVADDRKGLRALRSVVPGKLRRHIRSLARVFGWDGTTLDEGSAGQLNIGQGETHGGLLVLLSRFCEAGHHKDATR